MAVATKDKIKATTFDRFCELIYDNSGITLASNKEALVKSRLLKRMRQIGIDTYDDYLSRVTSDKSGMEMEELLDAISTNVTNFYREPAHFELMRTVIKDWVQAGASQLRVWSAACSTGEEPYTIAIEVLEALSGKSLDTKILATDIAPSVLRSCLRGEYSLDKMESVPKHFQTKYFTKTKAEGTQIYSISERVRNMVLFRQFNLNTAPYPLRGPLDLIFCRNVMIYFDRMVRARIVAEFSRLLKPGGYLFLGHSESLSGISEGYTSVQPSVYVKA